MPYFFDEQRNALFAVFLRSDMGRWQWIAGGVEEGEDLLDAARRECWEEAGINQADVIQLDSIAAIPADTFGFTVGEDGVYVVIEYAFAVQAKEQALRLSSEHLEYKWLKYDEAMELLAWDSNKTALWELNQRIANGSP
ncbi:MAG: NUDIX pyrophosphatase [Firmicutes bacterium]|nr:NUDIX pyrophosphatase [Bacillota bacterium]